MSMLTYCRLKDSIMSTVEKGNSLENYVLARLQEIDPQARKRGKPYDVVSKYAVVECKNLAGQSVSIPARYYDKLLAKMPMNTNQLPIVVREISDGRRFVILDFDYFVDYFLKVLVESGLMDLTKI